MTVRTDDAVLYVATPNHSGDFPFEYVQALLATVLHFNGRIVSKMRRSSVLYRSRDLLLSGFLASPATHYLSVDADMGWTPENVEALLSRGVDFVSGCYAKKNQAREPTYLLAPGETYARDRLLRATHVPGGFFLMTRAAAERLTAAHPELRYVAETGEPTTALHLPMFTTEPCGEDVAFCRRWAAIGGEMWVDPTVEAQHVGRCVFLPANKETP